MSVWINAAEEIITFMAMGGYLCFLWWTITYD
jgi:hypothetical protein